MHEAYEWHFSAVLGATTQGGDGSTYWKMALRTGDEGWRWRLVPGTSDGSCCWGFGKRVTPDRSTSQPNAVPNVN